MNHSKIYNDIINRAKERNWTRKSSGTYTEKHHIIPKCMEGTDIETNLVLLTAKEHYICHVLLSIIHKDTKYFGVLSESVRIMKFGNDRNFTGSMYEKLRIIASKSHSKRISGKNHPLFKGWYITPFGTFESAREASNHIPVTDMTISRRCKSNSIRWKEWKFKNKNGDIEGLPTDGDYYSGQNNHQSIGIWKTPYGDFDSLSEAGKTIGCDPGTVRFRTKSKQPKWKDWLLG